MTRGTLITAAAATTLALAGCGGTRTIVEDTTTVVHTTTTQVIKPPAPKPKPKPKVGKVTPAPVQQTNPEPTSNTGNSGNTTTSYIPANIPGAPAGEIRPQTPGNCPSGYTPNADGGVVCIPNSVIANR